MSRPLRVALVEDDVLLRALIAELVDAQEAMEVVATASGQRAALDAIAPGTADVAVLDIDLDDGNGIALGLALQEQDPRIQVLLLSNHNMLGLVRSVAARAPSPWSYLSKRSVARSGQLVRALAAVAHRQVVIDPALADRSVPLDDSPLSRLSAAQFHVLQLVAQGDGNGAVAEHLGITTKAVESHLTAIYKLLDLEGGANNRVAAVLAFLQQSVRPEM
ncbi:response regulator transcription factor [Oerskovia paurometabola]|uniref:response regulator transcription factor n=1 Tax=Oerskovia paurometabola TaxID=162170 RepID=UPI0038202C5D